MTDQTRPRLLVTTRGLERLARPPAGEFDIAVLDEQPDRNGWLAANGRGIRAVLAAGFERLGAAELDLLPDLEIIAVTAAGMAGVDLDAARARGVAVTNAGNLNAGDVADYALTMLLAYRRQVLLNDAHVRGGHWPAGRLPMQGSISKERVGIVGLGFIGRAVAERLVPFGCEIAWWGPRPKPETPWRHVAQLEELADWASILVVAVRAEDSTRGLIDPGIIERLGSEGLLVNVSRGFVVDEEAMVAALRDGRLGGAALDVFEDEPIDGSRFADLPNVLLSPHVAGGTRDALAAVLAAAVENIRNQVQGRPLFNRVV